MHCVVTAGPTYESLDEVRRLTNFSTGKLGSELANFLAARGHTVTLPPRGWFGRSLSWREVARRRPRKPKSRLRGPARMPTPPRVAPAAMVPGWGPDWAVACTWPTWRRSTRLWPSLAKKDGRAHER